MSNLKPIKQNHTVNIVFDGTAQELVEHLKTTGLDVEFIPPGLINSASVLIVKTNNQDKKASEQV